MKLYEYQKKHVMELTSILSRHRGALDRSATGTGKTVCALSVAKALKKPVAVIAPLGTLPGWKRTADALSVPAQIINYESLTTSRGFVTPSSINIEENSLVIYDEAHRCKNWKTQNAASMLRISRAGFPILALSATLAHNAEHLRAWNDAFNFCNAYSFSDFMRRCGYYYRQNRWGGEWLAGPDALRKTRTIIDPFSSEMTLEDAKDLFRENSISVKIISSKEDRNLKKLYDEALGKFQKTGDQLTAILRARQAADLAKVPYAVETATEIINQSASVALFVNFNETADTLYRELKDFFPAIIRGGQTARDREENRRKFQDNETPVIICNLQAGGVGLDLHDLKGRQRYTQIFPSWSAIDLKQTLGRIHRANALSDAIQEVVFSDVPVERGIARAVEKKLHALDTLHNSETNVFHRKEENK